MAKRLTRSAATRVFVGSNPTPRLIFKMEKENKKVYMIHGWGGSSEDNWFPWMKEELEKKGLNVVVFDMPNTNHPKIEEWVDYLRENISSGKIDEDAYFIGHSIGCQTIMRFLEKLHKHKKVGGCIFVAPFFDLINLEPEEMVIAHLWTNSEIAHERILDHCNNFLCIFSDDDPEVHLKEADKFRERLGAKIIIEKKRGHFLDKIQPRVLDESLKFLKVK